MATGGRQLALFDEIEKKGLQLIGGQLVGWLVIMVNQSTNGE